MGFGGLDGDSGFLWTATSSMVQYGQWNMVGSGGTVDSLGQPPDPWYSTDSGIWWAQVGRWIPLDSHLSHGTSMLRILLVLNHVITK